MQWRGVVGGGVAALVLGLVAASPTGAQVAATPPDGILQVTTSTTTSTTAPPPPPPPNQQQGSQPQGSQPQGSQPQGSQPAGRQPAAMPAGLPPSVAEDVPSDVPPFPPELQAVVNSVRRTRPNDTRALVAALAPLERFGLDARQRAVVGFGLLPVVGPSSWTDDWWMPRFGPGWRLHQGLDIAADHGTPVRTPAAGSVELSQGGNGGLGIRLTEANGNSWYFAHLSAFAQGLEHGQSVVAGQIIGFVGDTGNAEGQPHLHLELRNARGVPVPPKQVVDRLLADALAGVPALLARYEANTAAPTTSIPAPAVHVPDTDELVTLMLSPITPASLRWVLPGATTAGS